MDNRRTILRTILMAGVTALTDLSALATWASNQPSTPRMPVLFVGHGNPMHAITENPFATQWRSIALNIPKPSAIVVISAHWQTRGTKVTAMERPTTIHDFSGFPDELFAVQYPAPGSPELAQTIAQLTKHTIELDHRWGLDHGTWAVLRRMYPEATIPVIQISLDVNMTPAQHVSLAADVAVLRERGVLLVGSGNIVHNLGMMSASGKPLEWAREFDSLAANLIIDRNVQKLAQYETLGRSATLSIPTNEHYLPMLWALAATTGKDEIKFFNSTLELGSISMRSFLAFENA